ncbi:OpgC protein [Thalassoglobus polymorphus]|uniref:OpgC protein n=1 Tax=Thalassoglobus polymorphus TaxID=2527994 RepID=A0A517QS53_9PLAN|nr:OpgC protein [Thalassoglobus polymorphus]
MGQNLPPLTHGSKRDIRIDLARGVALLILVSDHLPGNPLRAITPVSWGLADMAEVFVLLSGYVFGLGILKRQSQSEPQLIRKRLVKRALVIFVAYLTTALIALLIVRTFQITTVANMLPAHLVANSWRSVTVDLISLDGRVSHLCILLLYCWLLLGVASFPCIVWNHPRLLIACSFILWITVQLLPRLSLPEPIQTTTYYNPFAWQFLFLSATTYALLPVKHRKQFLDHRGVFPILLIVHGSLYLLIGFDVNLPRTLLDKPTLGLLRYIHVVTAALLVRAVLPEQFSPTWRKVLRPLTLCSEQSLWVYCGGSLVAISMANWMSTSVGTWDPIFMNLIAWTTCFGIAWGTERTKAYWNFQS